MIKIKGLCKQFGSTVVFENVDLEIKKGETAVILGGSGCGKSTLLRCINRLEVPERGQILIDGQDILAPGADVAAIRRKLGMVYQNFNLFSHLNVMENMILAPMKVLGLGQSEAIERAEALLEKVGMHNRKFHMPSQLSGGQKQRVAIARAMAMEPQIMLFDEPTSALDPTMVDEVESVIRRLMDTGMTCVIVTHEMRFARNVATNIVFMAEKGIYEQGTSEEFFGRPARELTRQFLYRSRMLERTINRENIDIYGLCSDLRIFAQPYGFTPLHNQRLDVVCDELILPLLYSGDETMREMTLRYVAGEGGDDPIILLEFPYARQDPLQHEILDEFNHILLQKRLRAVSSTYKQEGVWEVTCTL